MTPPDLTPEQLIAAAESLEAQAALLRELARLRSGGMSVNVKPPDMMTHGQIVKRGYAIALAKAQGSPLLLAIAGSKWKTAKRYATERLQVKPASLTQWHKGRAPVPGRVADLVAKDFGLSGTKIWPKGVA